MIQIGAALPRTIFLAGAALSCATLVSSATPGVALAEPLTRSHGFFNELRIGALAHDLESNEDEDGWDVNAELLFNPLGHRRSDWLDFFLTPRPHIGGSINLAGDTSLAYAGLTWDIWLTDDIFVEGSFGGAVHDGPTDDSNSSFGCAVNFRESASVGVALSEHWRILGTVSHMSNAGLCGENQGLTSAGVQLGYQW